MYLYITLIGLIHTNLFVLLHLKLIKDATVDPPEVQFSQKCCIDKLWLLYTHRHKVFYLLLKWRQALVSQIYLQWFHFVLLF